MLLLLLLLLLLLFWARVSSGRVAQQEGRARGEEGFDEQVRTGGGAGGKGRGLTQRGRKTGREGEEGVEQGRRA